MIKVYLDLGDNNYSLDLWDYEAEGLLRLLTANPQVVVSALADAIQSDNERRSERQQEALMESGGVDDLKYRESLRDAGRGHLLR